MNFSMNTSNFTSIEGNIKIYFSEIRNNSNLTRDDELKLFGRIQASDRSAETEIFNKTAKFAVAVAKTYTGNNDLLEDLIQEANMGILDAIHRYDLNSGFRFTSFAVYYIKMYINKFLGVKDTVHAPISAQINKIKKVRNEFYKKFLREPSDGELLDILEEMGETIKDIDIIRQVNVSSLDKSVTDDSGDSISMYETGEIARYTSSENDVYGTMESDDIKEQVMRKLAILDAREKKFVCLFFGIGVDFPMDFQMISKNETEAGNKISDERVRQIINAAIAKMRK